MIYNNFIMKYLLRPMSVLLIVAGVSFTLWLRSSITSLDYKLGSLQEKKQQILKERRRLLSQRENLLSVKNIELVAIKKLGLVSPDRSKIFWVKGEEEARPFRAVFHFKN